MPPDLGVAKRYPGRLMPEHQGHRYRSAVVQRCQLDGYETHTAAPGLFCSDQSAARTTEAVQH